MTPSLAAVIEPLLAPHPADRPRSAADVLGLLGRSSARAAWEAGARGTHVREQEVAALLALAPDARGRRVLYVTGPGGAGKSHLVREATTRALLAGRAVRALRFPAEEPAQVARLVAFLRGDAHAAPWGAPAGRPLLLVLDDLQAAPAEVSEAVEAFRCMMHASSQPVVVLATTRGAPAGAESLPLAGLDRPGFAELCHELGAAPDAVDALLRETGGLPGWAAAALGRVPLTRDAVLARFRELDADAQLAVAVVATMGGAVPVGRQPPEVYATSFVAGLLTRERDVVRLASPQLARDLADAVRDVAFVQENGPEKIEDKIAIFTDGSASTSGRSETALATMGLPMAMASNTLQGIWLRDSRVSAKGTINTSPNPR